MKQQTRRTFLLATLGAFGIAALTNVAEAKKGKKDKKPKKEKKAKKKGQGKPEERAGKRQDTVEGRAEKRQNKKKKQRLSCEWFERAPVGIRRRAFFCAFSPGRCAGPAITGSSCA